MWEYAPWADTKSGFLWKHPLPAAENVATGFHMHGKVFFDHKPLFIALGTGKGLVAVEVATQVVLLGLRGIGRQHRSFGKSERSKDTPP